MKNVFFIWQQKNWGKFEKLRQPQYGSSLEMNTILVVSMLENIFERNLLATLLKLCRAELADEQSALATGCLAEGGHSLLGSG